MSQVCYSQSGKTVELGREIGRGGEGVIHEIPRITSQCAKLYSKPVSGEHLLKLSAMVAAPPTDPTFTQHKHHSISWPQELLFEDTRQARCLGFIMPRIDTAAFQKAFVYINPEDRIRRVSGGFNWKYLHTAAFNIASSVGAIHERGHCVGDLNESNLLISSYALISIIDCDSFQVRDRITRHIYRCPVGKQEYTAPELQGRRYEQVDRTLATDRFALAVLLFQLLMEGTHPYQAIGDAVEDAPSTQLKIVKGLFPYAKRARGVSPPPFAPPFDILDPEVQKLFLRCFTDGHREPGARPSALEWFEALRRCEAKFRTCSANGNHVYLPHLRHCPWCEHSKKMGRDSFPASLGGQVALDDPTRGTGSLEDRRAYLRSLVDIALTDGVLTHQEREHVVNKGLALQFSRQEIEELLNEEVKKTGSRQTASGNPKIVLDKIEFQFKDLPQSTQSVDSFTISNQGGGVLSGSLRPNKSWIICQDSIDTSKHVQKIEFKVDTRGLPFGFGETGEIDIISNGGNRKVLIALSVELPEVALGRFNSRLAMVAMLLGAFCGLVVFGVSKDVEISKMALSLAGICLTMGAFFSRSGLGCAALIASVIWMSVSGSSLGTMIASGYLPSAIAWSLLFASAVPLTGKWTFKAWARGTRVPYPFLGACVLQVVVVLYFALVPALVPVGAANNPTQRAELYRVEITGDLVNIRSQPSTNGKILQKVPKGTVLDVDAESGDWREVRLKAGSTGPMGWIHQSFVRKLGQSPSATPLANPIAVPPLVATKSTAEPVVTIPPLPYKDQGACPFEGCVYRDWKATEDVPVREAPDIESPTSFVVKGGEIVHAETGIVVTTKTGLAKVVRAISIGKKQVLPGENVYLLHYNGEGYFLVWSAGETATLYVASEGEKSEEAALIMTAAPKTVWWVKLRNAAGQVGWTDQPANFSNSDAHL